MPVYEYQCAECSERFEWFVRSASQENGAACPRCGSGEVRKAISLFGVGKGSGAAVASRSSCAPTSPT